MITIMKARREHVEGICRVCTLGYWDTYGEMRPASYIQRIVDEFYNSERVAREVQNGEYWVAVDGETVVGAGGGGMISDTEGELFALYVDPERRYEGIGTLLLTAITDELRESGAKVMWVSVAKGNKKGIPFYESRGFTLQGERKAYASLDDEDYVSLRYFRQI
ncbi:GNAT family N-acetyltransferase [Alicyclobacillus cycloheptanicus]|uniref:Ribosomal protein S18 acetylase RimI-like enzyme n=1 Tax=Alicyclobacillus cycloheptanicus TaxID=1457 RepID=A0ABT9XMD2_9BACL|nr:GNAT family N-acetyltransferase [Alicyclobacillus cycloheptanicus]MDQ0191445.1 ribosomal protein S18 acetylase RimI-like enzyme [Alicyclobacillus cycloheptanicus]WDM00790.1 GNAT family N-acetyltransferase [Alicyclobacillus cycloheptanicus]